MRELHGAGGDYVRELELRFRELDLSGKRILLDCANGAAYRVAPQIFRRLGAAVDVVADEPDGRNINAGCGSTHIDGLAETVAGASYDAAFAFDGDADRVLAVDRNGEIVDGDEIIAIAALHLHRAGRLPGPGVAVTVDDPSHSLRYDSLIDLVQELRDAGAEALAINGMRIGAASAFFPQGGAITLDGAPLKPPCR